MNTPAETHEVGIVAFRADGSTIDARDLLDYLDSVRIAGGVIDGARLGQPEVHTVRLALDADELVLRSDDLPPSLPWQGLVRSLVHRFDTVALVDDGVVDRDGRHYTGGDLPEELDELMDTILDAETHSLPLTLVHVLRTDPDLDGEAQSIANRGDGIVEVAEVDGFTLIHDTLSTDPGIVVDVALRSQLPAVSFSREGDARGAVVGVRHHGRTVVCHVDSGVPAELTAGLSDPATRDLLRGEVTVWFPSRRRRLDDALVARLKAAGTGETAFVADVADAIGVPLVAADWLEGGAAPASVTVVGPLSKREMLARGLRGAAGDLRTELSREEITKGPLGGLRRFLIEHPGACLIYGLTELALAVVFLTVAAGWGLWAPVRWILVIYFAVDGLFSLGVAAVSWRGRLRA
ncbi:MULTISPECIES: hypothetical protein [unclassified Aeromicrobium]|uniref:hypothetical protein n=1 Tax=unclassified Aeromicrobium TaxID=2633570 RepID=UPI00396AF35B